MKALTQACWFNLIEEQRTKPEIGYRPSEFFFFFLKSEDMLKIVHVYISIPNHTLPLQ